jgi:hypothetical protein
MNYMGYNSLCSFSPFSTLILIGLGLAIFLTTFKIKFERWGPQYRLLAGLALGSLAVLTILPVQTGYKDLIGYSTLCPLAPLSTLLLAGMAFIALMGYVVCPFLVLMRCRCPVLEKEMDAKYAPDRAILRYLKLMFTGKLSEEDVRRLYRCTLCNGCWLSWFNRSTRAMAVHKGIVPTHLAFIKGSVSQNGNPYGVTLATDFNPGSSPTASMPMVLSLACTQMKMTPAEAITAATVNAAYSLPRKPANATASSAFSPACFAIWSASWARSPFRISTW